MNSTAVPISLVSLPRWWSEMALDGDVRAEVGSSAIQQLGVRSHAIMRARRRMPPEIRAGTDWRGRAASERTGFAERAVTRWRPGAGRRWRASRPACPRSTGLRVPLIGSGDEADAGPAQLHPALVVQVGDVATVDQSFRMRPCRCGQQADDGGGDRGLTGDSPTMATVWPG